MEAVNKTDKDITFKKCGLADIPLMIKTATKAYCDHYLHVWKDNPDFYVKRSFSKAVFKEDFLVSDIEYYLIFYNNLPVGIIKINLFKGLDNKPNRFMLELEKIYIKKAYCGMQIGGHSLLFLKDIAQTKNIRCIWVHVMTRSRAIDFYKKQDFIIVNFWYLDFEELKDNSREMVTMKLVLLD